MEEVFIGTSIFKARTLRGGAQPDIYSRNEFHQIWFKEGGIVLQGSHIINIIIN